MSLAEATQRQSPAKDALALAAASGPAIARKPAAVSQARTAPPAAEVTPVKPVPQKPAPMVSQPSPSAPSLAVPQEVAALNGRVDAVDNGQLFGWVWDRNRPEARVMVRVLLDGAELAVGIADKPRVDLRRNGIGDGHHAFALDLPPQALQSPDRLTVIAVAVDPPAELVLRRPSADEKAAEAAVAAPMARVLDRLDLLVAAQRQLQLGQRDTGASLKETAQRLDAMSDNEIRLEDALATVRAGQSELSIRLDQMEIFLTRFDTSLAGFDRRLEVLGEQGRNEIKPQFFALAVLIGMGIGLALAIGLKI